MGRRTGRAERCRAGPRPHEARWDMVFQRVAQGETVQEVCRDPRLPSQQAFNWWVAHDPERLNLVHSALVAQSQVTDGFPYILMRAHELAVVTVGERRAFEEMVMGALIRRELKAGISQKAQGKAWTGAGKRRFPR